MNTQNIDGGDGMDEMTEEERLVRNLKDAGCNEETTQKYLLFHKEGKIGEQLRLLTRHKSSLLDQLHISQRMVDCLDYLIYTIKNKQQ